MNIKATLHKIYREEKAKPFSWADGGCLAFPALCVSAVTGQPNLLSSFLGEFKTEAGALIALNRAGYKDVEDVLDRGFERVPVAAAQPGYLALVIQNGNKTIGVVIGEFILASTPQGIGRVPLLEASAVFRVEPPVA